MPSVSGAAEQSPPAAATMSERGDRIPQIPAFDGSQAKWPGYKLSMGGLLHRLRLSNVSQETLLGVVMCEGGAISTASGTTMPSPYSHWLQRVVPEVISQHKGKFPAGQDYKGQSYMVDSVQVPDLLDSWWQRVVAEYQKPDPQALLEMEGFRRGQGKGVPRDESVPDAVTRFIGIHERVMEMQKSQHEQSLCLLEGINLPGVQVHIMAEGGRDKIAAYTVRWATDRVLEFHNSCIANHRLLHHTNPEAVKALGLQLPGTAATGTASSSGAALGQGGSRAARPSGPAQPRALVTADPMQQLCNRLEQVLTTALRGGFPPQRGPGAGGRGRGPAVGGPAAGGRGMAVGGRGQPFGCTEPGCPKPRTHRQDRCYLRAARGQDTQLPAAVKEELAGLGEEEFLRNGYQGGGGQRQARPAVNVVQARHRMQEDPDDPWAGMDVLVTRELPTPSRSSVMAVTVADLNDAFDAAVQERYAYMEDSGPACMTAASSRDTMPVGHLQLPPGPLPSERRASSLAARGAAAVEPPGIGGSSVSAAGPSTLREQEVVPEGAGAGTQGGAGVQAGTAGSIPITLTVGGMTISGVQLSTEDAAWVAQQVVQRAAAGGSRVMASAAEPIRREGHTDMSGMTEEERRHWLLARREAAQQPDLVYAPEGFIQVQGPRGTVSLVGVLLDSAAEVSLACQSVVEAAGVQIQPTGSRLNTAGGPGGVVGEAQLPVVIAGGTNAQTADTVRVLVVQQRKAEGLFRVLLGRQFLMSHGFSLDTVPYLEARFHPGLADMEEVPPKLRWVGVPLSVPAEGVLRGVNALRARRLRVAVTGEDPGLEEEQLDYGDYADDLDGFDDLIDSALPDGAAAGAAVEGVQEDGGGQAETGPGEGSAGGSVGTQPQRGAGQGGKGRLAPGTPAPRRARERSRERSRERPRRRDEWLPADAPRRPGADEPPHKRRAQSLPPLPRPQYQGQEPARPERLTYKNPKSNTMDRGHQPPHARLAASVHPRQQLHEGVFTPVGRPPSPGHKRNSVLSTISSMHVPELPYNQPQAATLGYLGVMPMVLPDTKDTLGMPMVKQGKVEACVPTFSLLDGQGVQLAPAEVGLDTGCGAPILLDVGFLQSHPLRPEISRDKASLPAFRVPGGTKLAVVGSAGMDLLVQDSGCKRSWTTRVKVVLVNGGLPYPMILGMPVLRALGAEFHFGAPEPAMRLSLLTYAMNTPDGSPFEPHVWNVPLVLEAGLQQGGVWIGAVGPATQAGGVPECEADARVASPNGSSMEAGAEPGLPGEVEEPVQRHLAAEVAGGHDSGAVPLGSGSGDALSLEQLPAAGFLRGLAVMRAAGIVPQPESEPGRCVRVRVQGPPLDPDIGQLAREQLPELFQEGWSREVLLCMDEVAADLPADSSLPAPDASPGRPLARTLPTQPPRFWARPNPEQVEDEQLREVWAWRSPEEMNWADLVALPGRSFGGSETDEEEWPEQEAATDELRRWVQRVEQRRFERWQRRQWRKLQQERQQYAAAMAEAKEADRQQAVRDAKAQMRHYRRHQGLDQVPPAPDPLHVWRAPRGQSSQLRTSKLGAGTLCLVLLLLSMWHGVHGGVPQQEVLHERAPGPRNEWPVPPWVQYQQQAVRVLGVTVGGQAARVHEAWLGGRAAGPGAPAGVQPPAGAGPDASATPGGSAVASPSAPGCFTPEGTRHPGRDDSYMKMPGGYTLCERPDLPGEVRSRFEALLTENDGVFARSLQDLGCYTGELGPARIPLVHDRSIFEAPRRHSPRELEIQQAKCTELKEAGIIRPSNSSKYALNSTMPGKKDAEGNWTDSRYCCDARPLNAATVPDSYRPQCPETLFDCIGPSRWMSKCDCRAAFNQIPLAPEDQEKTSFWWNNSLWCYTRNLYGLRNATACFQRVAALLCGLCR